MAERPQESASRWTYKPPTKLERFPGALFSPQIRLSGLINDNKFIDFQSQLDNALKDEGQLAVELTTPGGDADLARRMDIQMQPSTRKGNILY